MQLPPELRDLLDDLISTTPTAELARASVAVSERYRRLKGGAFGIASMIEAKAYLATRFPATFCAASKTFEALAAALPGFSPETLLDVGAGPGTAALAALRRWPALRELDLVEPNAHLQALGEKLLDAVWRRESIDRAVLDKKYDLAVSAYVLNELAEEKGADALEDAVRKMWQAAGQALVIIEPGTPAGQGIVLRARKILL